MTAELESSTAGTIAERLAAVEERLAAACERCRRPRESVRVVAVAKTWGPDTVAEAGRCGLTVIGENRVQEARQKIPLCPGHLEWHMIGHLQRNKVRDAVRLFRMVHSIDSLRLLQVLDEACDTQGTTMPVCIQVNVSGEPSKFGVAPSDLAGLLEGTASLLHVDVVGLMTIPPFTEDSEDARPYFARLRALRDDTARAVGFELPELSMGMSNDFEVAVEEGATLVRLGTVLFGRRASSAMWRDSE